MTNYFYATVEKVCEWVKMAYLWTKNCAEDNETLITIIIRVCGIICTIICCMASQK